MAILEGGFFFSFQIITGSVYPAANRVRQLRYDRAIAPLKRVCIVEFGCGLVGRGRKLFAKFWFFYVPIGWNTTEGPVT